MKELIPQEVIEHRILLIRGQKVMLDRDLAGLYGVTTAQLTRQVRRNIDRFPDDFMFQLTKEELADLICQFGTSSWGGTRKLPYAFTEQGEVGKHNKLIIEIFEIIKQLTQPSLPPPKPERPLGFGKPSDW